MTRDMIAVFGVLIGAALLVGACVGPLDHPLVPVVGFVMAYLSLAALE